MAAAVLPIIVKTLFGLGLPIALGLVFIEAGRPVYFQSIRNRDPESHERKSMERYRSAGGCRRSLKRKIDRAVDCCQPHFWFYVTMGDQITLSARAASGKPVVSGFHGHIIGRTGTLISVAQANVVRLVFLELWTVVRFFLTTAATLFLNVRAGLSYTRYVDAAIFASIIPAPWVDEGEMKSQHVQSMLVMVDIVQHLGIVIFHHRVKPRRFLESDATYNLSIGAENPNKIELTADVYMSGRGLLEGTSQDVVFASYEPA